MTADTRALQVAIPDRGAVSALALTPPRPLAAFVFAHGAGAGMQHIFMQQLAEALGDEGIATLRFQFPAIERGLKRPDPPAVAHAAIRAAVEAAACEWPALPLFAGGKSFGGRMTSQAQAAQPLPGVRGIVFAGFPLHPAGRPALQRADHLARVAVPMLFLQGTRDALADATLIANVVAGLGERASMRMFDDADHAFHVRARSGSTDEAVLREMARTAAAWMAGRSGAASLPGPSGPQSR